VACDHLLPRRLATSGTESLFLAFFLRKSVKDNIAAVFFFLNLFVHDSTSRFPFNCTKKIGPISRELPVDRETSIEMKLDTEGIRLRTIVHTEKAPAAVGPYSQGVKAGGFLFISGQLGVDMSTGEIAYDCVVTQTKQVLTNLESIAQAGGTSLAKAVKITVYLTNMGDFQKMNEVYATFFPENPPARVCVEVGALPKGVAVEMDAICLCED
jgi:2-iminobutanoate/2-iminopropanoate deaminase